ncbi:hypothetical protein [Alistipes sp.]|jgi:hypothetical protein|uniref:hypothetical protein n=1 Tax=Alistipes sp. TaxID=1872444 RepID=UPI0011CBA53A
MTDEVDFKRLLYEKVAENTGSIIILTSVVLSLCSCRSVYSDFQRNKKLLFNPADSKEKEKS